MPIKRLLWGTGTGRDIHLLRGNSSRGLLPSLVVVDEDGSQPSAENYLLLTPTDSIFFRPVFRNQGPPGGDWENQDIGISVNTQTGIVTATAFPVRTLSNFVIEVLGKHGADITAITTMRIHVHDSVTRAWLTPEALTVRPSGVPRPETTTIRFAVRAEFDTGIVGDLTLNHGVQWSSSPGNNVDPATGYLQLDAADTTGDDRPITATLPAALGGVATPPAMLRVGEPWESISSPPKASIVVGGAWPGTVLPDRVPNILFLGDGFREEDRDAFNRIVDKIVHHLKTDKVMRPWDLLSTSMNFWRVFQPSRALGISLRGEVFTSQEGTRTWAQAMPLTEKPPAAGAWGFGNLLYAAGLPMPADVGRASTAIKADWDAVFDTGTWPAGVKDLIDGWKSMGNRGFVEERDAFPGMSYGTPPAASSDDNRMLNHHEERGGAAARKAFYNSLKADNGVTTEAGKPVGDLWVTSFPSPYDFDNTDLVVLMTAVPAGRAVNGAGYIAMTRTDEASKFAVQPVAGRTEWTLDLHAAPDGVTNEVIRTAAHELAHSFGLGDEYMEFDGVFTGAETALSTYGNLQTERAAQVEVTEAGHTIRVIRGDEIKWNWHRIRKAGVLDGPLKAENGNFRVSLKPDHGFQFTEGDKVLIRYRLRGIPLQKRQPTHANGKEFKIVDASESNAVVIEPLTPLAPGELDLYGDWCILYIPTPAPESVRSASYPYAEMVAKNIKDSLTTRRRPLTALVCVTDKRDTQKPDLTGVSLPGILCFKHKTEIVGLYSGGAQWACGIFHPAGTCMMRHHTNGDAGFCAVCRYVLVDFVNPIRHFEIDRDYAEIYPQD